MLIISEAVDVIIADYMVTSSLECPMKYGRIGHGCRDCAVTGGGPPISSPQNFGISLLRVTDGEPRYETINVTPEYGPKSFWHVMNKDPRWWYVEFRGGNGDTSITGLARFKSGKPSRASEGYRNARLFLDEGLIIVNWEGEEEAIYRVLSLNRQVQ